MTDHEATVTAALAELNRLYDRAVALLRADIAAFAADGTLPPAGRRDDGSYAYPELRIDLAQDPDNLSTGRAFGRLTQRGVYTTTVTRPALFGAYLAEQLRLILEDYDVTLRVGASQQEIPFPYVLDGAFGAEIGVVRPADLARHFPTTELAAIGDEIADAEYLVGEGPMPLSLFDGLRTDFSLARLAHYTGTRPEDFQRYILFTNYHRYVDEFVDWAGRQLDGTRFVALSGAGGLCRPGQGEVDMDGVVGEDEAVGGVIDDAGVDQGAHVAMHGLDVATDAARRLPDRHGALAGHGLKQLPTLARQGPPEQLGRGERDVGALGLAIERRLGAAADIVARGDREGHGGHAGLHRSMSLQKSANCWAGVVKA